MPVADTVSPRMVATMAGTSSRTPANWRTNPRLPRIALTGGLRRRGCVAAASRMTFAIAAWTMMPTTRPLRSTTGSLRMRLSRMDFSASPRVAPRPIVTSGVVMMSRSVVASALTDSSPTLLSMSWSVTMPTAPPPAPVTMMSSLPLTCRVRVASRVGVRMSSMTTSRSMYFETRMPFA